MDEAIRENPGKAGCGGVIRGKHGVFMSAICCFLGEHTSMSAEAMAIFEGHHFAMSLQLKCIWLKLNSQVLVEMLTGRAHMTWHIAYII